MVRRALENVTNFYAVRILSACRSVKKANQIDSNFSLYIAQAAYL